MRDTCICQSLLHRLGRVSAVGRDNFAATLDQPSPVKACEPRVVSDPLFTTVWFLREALCGRWMKKPIKHLLQLCAEVHLGRKPELVPFVRANADINGKLGVLERVSGQPWARPGCQLVGEGAEPPVIRRFLVALTR